MQPRKQSKFLLISRNPLNKMSGLCCAWHSVLVPASGFFPLLTAANPTRLFIPHSFLTPTDFLAYATFYPTRFFNLIVFLCVL